ncbi:hypothetical protein MVES1_002202 [Malassezia vespertilionis]|uniref:Homeobox domain-containing protein n=1 Tax=Malassezia vespertilionis TaxID=2020962 RepID=A0A2N1JBQ7_9BASI|nr:uncharacterized protein MVES1_002202 [Malassezia vespertilionis]PKI83975.1 hypothetical protein MVES_002079 [Malassezia vespertilionis]WFD06848.1 hypothetical protein MVES1_002202 [Malassezia vespertilionis]
MEKNDGCGTLRAVRRDTHAHEGEKKRRRRTRPHEADILMRAYMQNAFPNEKTREHLAQLVGMAPRYVARHTYTSAISIWFQNRRQAEKKRTMRYNGGSTHYPSMTVPLSIPMSLPPLNGQRDLHDWIGPLPGMPLSAPEPANFRRTTSAPCVSLTTTLGGRAELGSQPQVDAHIADVPLYTDFEPAYHEDEAIWQRMESSSAVGSSETEPREELHEEDDEERTLRRLAQRNNARDRKAQRATDARLAIQERVKPHRPSRGFKRQSSLALEWAAGRNLQGDHEQVCAPSKLRRTESVPTRAPLRTIPAALPRPTCQARRAPGKENAPIGAWCRPGHSFRRVLSASSARSRVSPPGVAYWPRPAFVRQESSARSDVSPVPAKDDAQDDSGFFEEDAQRNAHISPGTHAARSTHTNCDAPFTEHDRQAVELLLGLGVKNACSA